MLRASAIHPLLDRFVPDALRCDADTYRRARMFLISHILGTPLGHLITAYLYVIDRERGIYFWVIVGAITAFFAFPFLLRRTGRLTLLSLLSLQNLTFIILFASYHYGGVSSPFLAWLLAVPIAGLFYLGTGRFYRTALLALLATFLSAYYVIYALGYAFPVHVPLADLAGVGLFSDFCAIVFVAMMALYYANIVATQQRELEREVASHRLTTDALIDAKDSAERANRAKSVFLANMSHELRTPLNAVIGFSELMSTQIYGPLGERYRSYLADIHSSGQHLLQIINDILDLSKIEAGKAALDREEDVALAAALGNVLRLLAPEAERKGIVIAMRMEQAALEIRGSGRMVQQIFLNIVSNALKFTPHAGKVAVTAGLAPSGDCVVAVSDSGIGMTQDEVDVALTPFGQVDGELNRKYDGTGLGLPLAKAMIELHQGRFDIASEPGHGTTVTVRFPAARVVVPARPRHALRPEAAAQSLEA